MSKEKKRILITYDYFTPAFKAGGPIQSLTNMVRLLGERYAFYVVTRDVDLDGTQLEVESDQWINFEGKAKVFYASNKNKGFSGISRLLQNVSPDIVYINGLFSLFATVYPLIYNAWHSKTGLKVIIAPRGMFQEGALALKASKKTYYLMVMKPFMKRGNVAWHATDEQEKQDILKNIGKKASISVAGNVPAIIQEGNPVDFTGKELRLVTVALVARKKNHLTFLRVLRNYTGERPIVYDIYGPVKDEDYWRECRQIMNEMPANVTVSYKGAVEPPLVAGILSNYHCFVLPTFGENFGHSIFEAMAAGLPVMISDKTPWQNIDKKGAGWIFDLNVNGDFERALEELITTSSEKLKNKGEKAKRLAKAYLENAGLEERYEEMFGG
ncbi:glycosyltransferase [Anaerophaga thermohalophila]|uniref:glycosyltransferase n=1 Tax=Anaerophaga thermohalophila TaxID=177400 RepID=UPI000237BCF0|nr:glycosyltransferase [Anaerophaga thermohalophila]